MEPRRRGLRVVAMIASVVAVTGVVMTSPATAAEGVEGPLVRTASGLLRGVVEPGHQAFLGVPYARPPIKDRRFRPPVPARKWSGIRAADRQAPACLQFEPTGVREGQATSEDCLYLDLYRPKGARRGQKRPVMVWWHGGGWTQGTGVIYGGGSMAAETGAIVVSINYRLGALGFLAHPALSAETRLGSGNYGLMDAFESLRWVRRNVARFGGDPGNVTIFGQSAGAGLVCSALASPSAKGLFDRAIVQSVPCGIISNPLAAGEESGRKFAAEVGCTDEATVTACLRKAWAPALVAAQRFYVGRPKVGGGILPVAPQAAIESGQFNRVPVITGTTRSEFRLLSTSMAGLTAEGYRTYVETTYGTRAPAVLDLYPLERFGSPYDAVTQLQTDASFACQTEKTAAALAKAVPTYRYEFDDPTSPTLYGFGSPGLPMTNAHSAELQYLFDFTLGEKPLTRTQERLATQMVRYWGSFADTGAPRAMGGPTWPRYAPGERVMSLRPGGASRIITTFAQEHHCDFWNSTA
jgi:para-nitrobenzyl esterase